MSQCRLPILDPMKAPQLLQRHRSLRWVAPVAVAAIVTLVATGVLRAGATQSMALPKTSPAALLADVRATPATGFSGTVVSTVSLGLPQLPDLGAVGAGDGDNGASLASLLSGSHTMQVWYGGPTKQRLALFGTTDETDVFRNGRDLWEWDSADRSAVHTILPAWATTGTGSAGTADSADSAGATGPASASPSSVTATLTPDELADRALAALQPSTQVRVGSSATVADRDAYTLTLTPRAPQSLIGSVRIFVDGATKTPLGVAVYPRNSTQAAIDVSFTSITFAEPAEQNFTFDPPADASVRVVDPHSHGRTETASPAPEAATGSTSTAAPRRVIGSGWSAVLTLTPGAQQLATIKKALMWGTLPAASGSWGHGRILESTLLTVLVTDDGRVYLGSVEPSALFAAAGSK